MMSNPDSFVERMLAGVDRSAVQWSPIINQELCTQCGACLNYCNRDVYGEKDGQIDIVNPINCMLLCNRCATICPNQAISHPAKKDLLKQITQIRKKQL